VRVAVALEDPPQQQQVGLLVVDREYPELLECLLVRLDLYGSRPRAPLHRVLQ
jgi:hypothetical protein